MCRDAPAFCHFHLRQSGAAASAPWHNVVPAIDETFLVAFLEKSPDRVVVFVGESKVAAAVLGRTQLADDLASSRRFDPPAGQLHGYNPISVSQRVAQRAQDFGIVPIAPIAEADGLLGLPCRVRQDAFLAGPNKLLNAVVANLALGLEPEALFHFDLDPKALAVESVLIALRLTVH